MLYNIGKSVFFILCRLLFRFKVEGRENIPDKGAFIVAGNHVSYLDPIIMGIGSPRQISFLAKEELFALPLLGRILSAWGVVPLRRNSSDVRALKTALAILKQGRPIGIFPQGQRARTDTIKSGVGFLASKAGVPVIAARISGTDRALPRGARMVRCRPVSVRYSVVDNICPSDSYEQITAKVFDRIKI